MQIRLRMYIRAQQDLLHFPAIYINRFSIVETIRFLQFRY